MRKCISSWLRRRFPLPSILVLAVLVLAWEPALAAGVAPLPTLASSPPPYTEQAKASSDLCLADIFFQEIDFCAVFKGAITAGQWVIWEGLGESINFVADTATEITLTTPAKFTYGSESGLRLFWIGMLIIVDSLVALALVYISIRMTLSGWLYYAEAIELLPRLLFALLAAHFSANFVELIIQANNAIATGLTIHNPLGFDLHTLIGIKQTGPTGNQSSTAIMMFIGIIYVLMSLLLFLQMIVRLALINLLYVTSPLWLFAWAITATQKIAQLCTTSFLAVVFVQSIQLFALNVGGRLLLAIDPSGDPQKNLLTGFLGIAVLAVTLAVPRVLGQWVTAPSYGRATAGVGRLATNIALVVRRV